jgi:hypothetical protein
MTNRLNNDELGDQYQTAMEEWYASEDAELWESTVGDGLEDEPERADQLPAPNIESGGAERRRPLRVLEDVVSADPPPDYVRLAVPLFLAVLPSCSTVRRPSQLENAVIALHSLDSKSGARRAFRT